MSTPTSRDRRSKDQGYYTVDAAVFLPIFVLAVMTIAYLMNIAGAKGLLMHVAADEGAALAVTSYELPTDLALERQIRQRVTEGCEDMKSVWISDAAYLFGDGEDDDLIAFDVEGRMELPLPFELGSNIEVSCGVLCKAWTGNGPMGDPFGFERMEREESADMVFVFPQTGMRYHGEDCTFVSAKPVQKHLDQGIKQHYHPCDVCHPDDLPEGSTVWCYEYGEVYHRSGCRYTEKNAVSINREDAESQGYTPCEKCGGQ